MTERAFIGEISWNLKYNEIKPKGEVVREVELSIKAESDESNLKIRLEHNGNPKFKALYENQAILQGLVHYLNNHVVANELCQELNFTRLNGLLVIIAIKVRKASKSVTIERLHRCIADFMMETLSSVVLAPRLLFEHHNDTAFFNKWFSYVKRQKDFDDMHFQIHENNIVCSALGNKQELVDLLDSKTIIKRIRFEQGETRQLGSYRSVMGFIEQYVASETTVQFRDEFITLEGNLVDVTYLRTCLEHLHDFYMKQVDIIEICQPKLLHLIKVDQELENAFKEFVRALIKDCMIERKKDFLSIVYPKAEVALKENHRARITEYFKRVMIRVNVESNCWEAGYACPEEHMLPFMKVLSAEIGEKFVFQLSSDEKCIQVSAFQKTFEETLRRKLQERCESRHVLDYDASRVYCTNPNWRIALELYRNANNHFVANSIGNQTYEHVFVGNFMDVSYMNYLLTTLNNAIISFKMINIRQEVDMEAFSRQYKQLAKDMLGVYFNLRTCTFYALDKRSLDQGRRCVQVTSAHFRIRK